MTTFLDALGKEVLDALLGPRLNLRLEETVTHEPQRIDALSIPGHGDDFLREIGLLGLLGRMVKDVVCQLELFSDAVQLSEVRDCQRRQLAIEYRSRLARQRAVRRDRLRGNEDPSAQLADGGLPELAAAPDSTTLEAPVDLAAALPTLPRLWLISAGDPRAVRRQFAMRPVAGWPRGVFRSTVGSELWLVVVPMLPDGRDTLALRLLGRGPTFERALQQLHSLPSHDSLREPLQQVIVHRSLFAPPSEAMDAERERFLMLTNPIILEYEKRLLDEGERKGERKGKLEGKAEAVVAVLQARGLTVTDEQRVQVLECQDAAQLDAWLRESITCATTDALFVSSTKPTSVRSRKRTPRS